MFARNKRIVSLDIIRGLAIIIMIFVDAPPSSTYYWQAHAMWEGLTLADMAFPGFVFAMGASAAVSKKSADIKKILMRTAILFLVGVIFNMKWSFFTFLFHSDFTAANLFDQAITHGRFFGILQRLALTYLLGMLIAKFIKSENAILISAFVLLILSSLGFHVYSPTEPFLLENNISGAVDKIFPGANHIYTPNGDPEGLYGTIASTAQFLFGFLAGKVLADNAFMRDKIHTLAILGVIFTVTGLAWSYFDIIAKNIWTAPFALITSAIEIFLLAAITQILNVLPQIKNFFQPIRSIGKNPLFFFLASNIIVSILCNIPIADSNVWVWIWQKTFQGLISTEFSVMIFCIIWTLFWIPCAMIFDRLGIIIKI